MKPKNAICLWFDKDAQEAARFYAATFPDSARRLPGGKEGDVLTVEFTVLGIPGLGLSRGPSGLCTTRTDSPWRHYRRFAFQ
jgi:predicted 3-demethylubiquinone-9 3-methyltransferase (glyoxalase superfamily)